MKKNICLSAALAMVFLGFLVACSKQAQQPPAEQTAPAQPTAQPSPPATQPSQPAATPATTPGGPGATEKHRLRLTNYAGTPVTVTVNGTWLGQWDTHSGWQPLEGVLAGKNEVTVEVQGTPDNQVTLELEAQRGDDWVNLLRLNFQGKTGAHTFAFVAR